MGRSHGQNVHVNKLEQPSTCQEHRQGMGLEFGTHAVARSGRLERRGPGRTEVLDLAGAAWARWRSIRHGMP